MKLAPRWYLYGLLLISVIGVAAFRYFHEDDVQSARSITQAIKVDGEPLPDIASQPASPDPLSLSKWLALRTKRYRNVLQGWQCDTLVVPVQVEEEAFDRATRNLMSGDIALALAGNSGCVTDPYLIDLALGEGLRRDASDDVTALAAELKAKTIVTSYAGHDRSNHMRVTLRVDRLDGSGPSPQLKLVAKKSFEDLAYGSDVSPFDALHKNLTRMLGAVGLDTRSPRQTSAGRLSAELPASPQSLIGADKASVLDQSARLVLLGILAPRKESRAGERAFAKAWLLLEDAAEDDPGVQRMRARILFHLFERPYALDRLKNIAGPEADGLRAVLNGNLPAAHAAVDKVQEPWERLFLTTETYDLELGYQRNGDATASNILGVLGPEWAALVSARFADDDMWIVPDMLALKRSLDTVFPIPGQSLQELMKGTAVIAQFDDPATYDLLAAKHVHALLESNPHDWCCAPFSLTPTRWDVLDLYDGRIDRALVDRVEFYAAVQWRPQQALDLLQHYDEVLAGNPAAEAARAYADRVLLENGGMANRDELNERIRTAARIAVVADPGQEEAPSSALWDLLQPPADPTAQKLGNAYCEDYPIRASWSGTPDTLEKRLEFSSSDIEPLKTLLAQASGDLRQHLLAELDERFVGDATATDLRLDEKAEKGQIDPSIVRAAISADPDNWNLYDKLAEIYMKHGEYAQASTLVQSFPPFHAKARRTVGLSDDAEHIANSLYYRGAIDAARPLLKIAADYNNGSQASVQAHSRLAILDGDFTTATLGFLESARHYQALSDYRDYLELLFAAGQSADAWSGFSQLIRRFDGPQPWIAAMIGHRRDNIDESGLRKWVVEEARGGSRPPGDQAVVNYSMMEQLTDRGVPSSDFVEFVVKIGGESLVKPIQGGKSFRGALGADRVRRVGPSDFGRARRAPVAADFVVPNRYALFAEAYFALRQERFEDSVNAFDRLAAYYDIETNDEWGFVLPYFALAAARSGDKLALETYLDSKLAQPNQWGVHLAKAVFEAEHGHKEAALTLLDTAFRERPATGNWPVSTSYQYAEICAGLFDLTKDDAYRQRALEWARAHRKIEPTHAWAHALVARLSSDEPERVEALAVALYLDPRSEWASQVPKKIHDQATEWLKKHPPFELRQSDNAT
ncbi:MAG: hypothetical protein P4L92_00955 [Rudaea sp.]|nr:hypothetical protein [Rudaea sp.]